MPLEYQGFVGQCCQSNQIYSKSQTGFCGLFYHFVRHSNCIRSFYSVLVFISISFSVCLSKRFNKVCPLETLCWKTLTVNKTTLEWGFHRRWFCSLKNCARVLVWFSLSRVILSIRVGSFDAWFPDPCLIWIKGKLLLRGRWFDIRFTVLFGNSTDLFSFSMYILENALVIYAYLFWISICCLSAFIEVSPLKARWCVSECADVDEYSSASSLYLLLFYKVDKFRKLV